MPQKKIAQSVDWQKSIGIEFGTKHADKKGDDEDCFDYFDDEDCFDYFKQ